MSTDRKKLGAQGEKLAADHLARSGYRILARNYVCPAGEIDLICHGDGAIVFVEVKSLEHDRAGDPEERITPAKQRKIELAARHWLAEHRQPDCAYRFDAVSVIIPVDENPPRIRHIVEAFIPRR
jgi:putative endonuclease